MGSWRYIVSILISFHLFTIVANLKVDIQIFPLDEEAKAKRFRELHRLIFLLESNCEKAIAEQLWINAQVGGEKLQGNNLTVTESVLERSTMANKKFCSVTMDVLG